MAREIMGVSFETVSWDKMWQLEIDRFNELSSTGILKQRKFFQKDNFLFVKYIFESGTYIIIPVEFIEKLAGKNAEVD